MALKTTDLADALKPFVHTGSPVIDELFFVLDGHNRAQAAEDQAAAATHPSLSDEPGLPVSDSPRVGATDPATIPAGGTAQTEPSGATS